MKPAEFADPDARCIEKSDLGFILAVFKRINNSGYLLSGRNLGQAFIKAQIWNLIAVPVTVKNILEEIPKLCDMDVDRPGFRTGWRMFLRKRM
ncbi:hypothetical protein ACLUXI_03385 [Bifidobacterium apri]|uniref:hypothetical protein n=1 Tax=Bifidobacterium apri TaxID=1769423 RepID=UPI0039960927